MIQKTYFRAEKTTKCRLTFTLPEHIWADSVYIVGDFNDWDVAALSMQQDAQGRWQATVEVAAGQAYQFRYLCDGDWINDNQADDYYANEYGGHNSVVLTDADPDSKP
jgi:1,4-alpha-glucan branching enzyme